MPLPEVGFLRNCKNISYRNLGRISALVIVVLVIALNTASCGTTAPGSSNGNSLTLSGSLPAGTVSQAYNAVLNVSGGSSPYQFAIVSGLLPPGLNMNSGTGSFSGTPSSAGSYTFMVAVTDSPHIDHGSQLYTLAISTANGVLVSVSPTSVTLNSGANQQFTATVTGTANTAVTWTATGGSLNSSGLYTAPVVQTVTNATVTATSQADPTKSASAAVTINPVSQSLQITSGTLPQAQQGTPYDYAFTATGGTTPYSWSISTGTLPPGLAMNANGDLAGLPTAPGTYSFTVMVTDATNETATGNFGITVTSGSGYDGPAKLPIATVAYSMADTPAPGATITVNAGGDLQSALNSAQCGDTIQLQAGATFTGKLTVPAKNCDVKHWVIIRTSSPDSALPAEGERLTPCYAGVGSLEGRPAYNCPNPKNVLAKIQMPAAGNGPIQLVNGANFYRFLGLEITRPAGLTGSAALISLQGTADHIIVDRSWLHGNPQDETSDGFATAGGTYIAVVDSYFNDFHCYSSCTDAHAVSGGTGDNQDGPFLIQDDFLEASGEAILFGGGPATTSPTDITVTGNHFWKPWQWMKGNQPFVGGTDGRPFIVKNHFELKNAVRVLVEANLMENSWGGFTQSGYGILLTPKNQNTKAGKDVCPNCQVTDVTIRYVHISHGGGGIQMATCLSASGKNGGGPALAGARFSIHDIVIDDLSTKYVGPGLVFQLSNSWPQNPLNNVTINHVTAFPDPSSHMIIVGNQVTNAQMYGLVFTNNLVITGQYPVWNTGGGQTSCAYQDVPITSVNNCFTTYTFVNNGLITSPPNYPPSKWPLNNMFPQTVADVGFIDFNNGNGGNYELDSNSPYKNKGTDGKDLGADIVGLNQALQNVE